MKRKPVPINMPPKLEAAVLATSQRIGLSKQDVMRLSMERGIPVLLRALGKPPPVRKSRLATA